MSDSLSLHTKLFINGEFVSTVSEKPKKLDVINPATGEIFHQVEIGLKEDVEKAVSSAKIALKGEWSKLPGRERAKYLEKIAEELLNRKERLATIETMDNGKTFKETTVDVSDSAACFSYYAQLAKELDESQVGTEDYIGKVFYEPIGVCAQIIPFNYPLLMASWKIAPALAAGCTIVLKPSEYTPVNALEIAQITQDIGLPKGVFNVLNGYGFETGAMLVDHPDVKKVAFTGSVITGKTVAKNSSGELKSVTLELGGKSPIIVFDDSDVENAVDWTIYGIFGNKGEVCTATSRLLIQDSIQDKFIKLLVEQAKKIVVGNGLKKESNMGPIISETQYKKILNFIEYAKNEGGELLFGGNKPKDSDLTPSKGYFIEPTIFKVTKEMKIWKEEIFGPVLSVLSFKTEEEALELANNTVYGLAGSIFTNDNERFERLSRKLEVGTVWHNCSQPVFYQTPFGGKKSSGIGRELSKVGLYNYLDPKTVLINSGNLSSDFLPK